MKRKILSIACLFFLWAALPVQAWAAEYLTPVGKVIGLQLRDGTVTVAAYDDALGSRAREAGLKIGDEIVSIDGQSVGSAGDVRDALAGCGETVRLTVRRGEKLIDVTLAPQTTGDGKKLGVYLRQGIAGIGTVTYYDPATGTFGALGHGVSGPRGSILDMAEGCAYDAQVQDVKKGAAGEPGQLRGMADGQSVFGVLARNTPQGVFGKTNRPCPGQPLPVADYGEVRTGPATILSTIAGEQVREYSVEILKIYPQDRTDGRNFLLKVTDPALLEATGGIVQGMSGSPLTQDGHLVGAVTHVYVNS